MAQASALCLMRPLVVALLFLGVLLAGCADSAPDEPDPEYVDPDSATLEDGKGAIAGLVIDDRFRPIPGATVLVQEAGKQVTSNENGEFAVLDLDPGAYTLRATAAGHEAAPETVHVQEGLFADANLVARRVVSTDGLIITQEYAIFIPCNAYATSDCPPDASGESYRPGIRGDFTEFAQDVTYSTWEVLLNNPYIFCFEVREEGTGGAATARHFGEWCEGQDSVYTKGILQNGERYDEVVSDDPWDPTAETDAILFTFGNNELTCWQSPPNDSHNNYRCAGVAFAVKAQIMVSFFMSEPEVDVEEYCIYCR